MIEMLTLVLLSGAVLYYSLGIGLAAIGMISTLTSAFFFIYFLSHRGRLFGIVIGVVLFLGEVTMWYYTALVPQAFFSSRVVTGTIESINRQLDKTSIVVYDHAFDQLIQVTIQSQNAALPGDTVNAYGTIQQPEDFMTSSGRLFPYQEY